MLTRNAYALISAVLAGGSGSSTKLVTVKLRTGSVMQMAASTLGMFRYISSISTSESTAGVLLSGDEAEPTLDDYAAPSSFFTKVSGSGNTPSVVVDGNAYEITSTLSVMNAWSDSIEIKSLYFFCTDPNSGNTFLLDHTKLANPITIPAGETKVFTYTIRLDIGA